MRLCDSLYALRIAAHRLRLVKTSILAPFCTLHVRSRPMRGELKPFATTENACLQERCATCFICNAWLRRKSTALQIYVSLSSFRPILLQSHQLVFNSPNPVAIAAVQVIQEYTQRARCIHSKCLESPAYTLLS